MARGRYAWSLLIIPGRMWEVLGEPAVRVRKSKIWKGRSHRCRIGVSRIRTDLVT